MPQSWAVSVWDLSSSSDILICLAERFSAHFEHFTNTALIKS
jgi:hypothetical protein